MKRPQAVHGHLGHDASRAGPGKLQMGKILTLLHLQISALVARATGNLHNCGQGPRSDLRFGVLNN